MSKKITIKQRRKQRNSTKNEHTKSVSQFLGSTAPIFWPEIVNDLPKRDSAAKLADKISSLFHPGEYLGLINQSVAHETWNSVGLYYRSSGRFYEAIKIYLTEYEEMIKAQIATKVRIHKGTPLCWAYDMFTVTNRPVLAKRHIMLTLCEDAISRLTPESTGSYIRLNRQIGMADSEIKRYMGEIWDLAKSHPFESLFPEWLLQRLDDKWMTEYPHPNELGEFIINRQYCEDMINKLGDGSGENLERLAQYLLSCIPGCRAKFRERTPVTDYDVVCVLEGNFLDFRSAIDRYFVCECKDWKKTVNSTTIYKFASVLRSINTNFGVIFSNKGISGRSEFRDAEREQVKIYQRDRIVIAVLNLRDLIDISRGGNLILSLREKYEKARLDLGEK